MIHDPCSIDHALVVLNEIAETDPKVLGTLIETRVPCSEALKKHPTVQVSSMPDGGPGVGLLGILNGIFGIDEKGWGPITAHFSVICTMPSCPATHLDIKNHQIGDSCPLCGKPLKCGPLIGFSRTEHKENG